MSALLKRRALKTTIIELADIKRAAHSGRSNIPKAWEKTPAAVGIARILYPVAQIRFWIILELVLRLKEIAFTTSKGSFRIKTISADSTATSVPAPIAIPTWAWVKEGASFTPSPTIATVLPRL